MKVEMIVPGMIYMLVDRRPVNLSISSKLPMHYYMVMSVGSAESTMQDIQMVSITSLSDKPVTNELPIVLNDSISYVIPYNMISFRKEDVKPEYLRGMICGNPDLITSSEFIELCKDVYMDTLYGKIEKSLSDRIKDYQSKFAEIYKDVPRYADVKPARTNYFQPSIDPNSTDSDYFNSATCAEENPSWLFESVKSADSLPLRYTSWTDDQVMKTLIGLTCCDQMEVVSTSSRFNSIAKIRNAKRQLRNRIDQMSNPIYAYCINGKMYMFNFYKRSVEGNVDPEDRAEVNAMLERVKKAMK